MADLNLQAISLICALAAAMAERDKPMAEREAAEFLGVSPASVRRWTDEGRLASVRYPGALVRYRPSQLEAFLVECSVKRRRGNAAPSGARARRESAETADIAA